MFPKLLTAFNVHSHSVQTWFILSCDSFNQHFRTNLSGLTFVYDASAWADRPLRRRPVHPTLTAATTHMLLQSVHNKAALVLCERWKSATRKKPDFLTVKWTLLHARGRVCTPICLWARVSLLCVSGEKSSLEWLKALQKGRSSLFSW